MVLTAIILHGMCAWSSGLGSSQHCSLTEILSSRGRFPALLHPLQTDCLLLSSQAPAGVDKHGGNVLSRAQVQDSVGVKQSDDDIVAREGNATTWLVSDDRPPTAKCAPVPQLCPATSFRAAGKQQGATWCRELRQAEIKASIGIQIDWINSLVEPLVPAPLWNPLPRFWKCWLRNWIFSILVYFGVGFTWAYYIYSCFGSDLFPKGNMPQWKDIAEQMSVSFWALPVYSLLPSITEELCERGHTLAYAHVSDVGVPMFLANLFMYMAFVEFGVYWMHRGLHDIPAGYKCAPLSPLAALLSTMPSLGLLRALPSLLMVPAAPRLVLCTHACSQCAHGR